MTETFEELLVVFSLDFYCSVYVFSPSFLLWAACGYCCVTRDLNTLAFARPEVIIHP